jgi:hypothetical protein
MEAAAMDSWFARAIHLADEDFWWYGLVGQGQGRNSSPKRG